MSRKQTWRLLLLLVILAVVLTGCGVTYNEDGSVDVPGWIEPIAAPLRLGVTLIHDFLHNQLGIEYAYGWAIILLTILIRVLLYPLTRKQMQSMKKMQDIQPKLKALQEKYGKDREKLTQKQMELYKEEGVNPAGGCLPLVIQMPILFGFYYALIGLGSALSQPFLWIPDLAFPLYTEGLGWLSPITPAHLLSPEVLPYLVLPVVYIVTQFVMQRMSQAANPTAQTGSMGNIMMFMPLMFGYITLIVPSGLTVYWVTSNFFQIGQQGLTTGWSGLLPSRRQPALATTGASASATASVQSNGTGGGKHVGSDTAPALSAGRRRKMRKKKR